MRGLAIATVELRQAKLSILAVPSLWSAGWMIVHALVLCREGI
jgi:hypothetical protein